MTTQEHVAPPPEMTLEIQSGEGPYSAPVQNPVKIGDNISLVVKAKSQMTGWSSSVTFSTIPEIGVSSVSMDKSDDANHE